jgi:hypothetical protein
MWVGSVGSAPSARHVEGMHIGGIELELCTQDHCGALTAAGPLHAPCDYGVLKGHPIPWVRCAGTVGAHGCCGDGVVLPPERSCPLRVCSYLDYNALTGSVPSSLSALVDLDTLCVPPSCHRRLLVRLRRVGSFGSAPSARHVGQCMSRASSRGDAAAGLVAVLSEMTLARDMTEEYSRGTPSCGYGARVPQEAHGCCGCGVVLPPSGRVRFGCAATSTTMR